MAYENIRLKEPNLTVVDGYYYMMDNDTDSLIVKTDDGTQAFSYPLDTTLGGNNVVSMEHDGRNFWSLEDGTGTIKRWCLDNYVCKLRNTYNTGYTGSDAFTVEHYHLEFTGTESAGQTNLSCRHVTHNSVDLTTVVDVGDTLYLGPNSAGESEERTVTGVAADNIDVNPAIDYDYVADDPISSYRYVWVFDDAGGGKLHKYDPYTTTTVSSTLGGEYASVDAATFYDMYDITERTDWADAICYVRTTNLLFTDPSDLINFGSLAMDNVEDDQSTVIDLHDISIDGTNIYRLQLKATYYGVTYVFADSTYNYQLSTTIPFITSISLAAEPAILPANGVNSSAITAIVKDQFNGPISSKNVYFTDDDPVGFITASPISTNANGVAQTAYKAGTTAREVKLTATAEQT